MVPNGLNRYSFWTKNDKFWPLALRLSKKNALFMKKVKK